MRKALLLLISPGSRAPAERRARPGARPGGRRAGRPDAAARGDADSRADGRAAAARGPAGRGGAARGDAAAGDRGSVRLRAPFPTYPRRKRRRGLCPPVKKGEHCGPGNGRRSSGGGDKVSHAGWPAVTGVFFVVQRRGGKHRFTGTKLNDEILGYDGHDRLAGGKGKDILWGDWHAVPQNPASQRDTLLGGPGKDFIYTSHGRNVVKGGAGNDRVYAHWGRGVIDCGPGEDWVGVNNFDFHYKLRGCEHRVQW